MNIVLYMNEFLMSSNIQQLEDTMTEFFDNDDFYTEVSDWEKIKK